MKTKTDNHKFLETGIQRYEEAYNTITAFEIEMKKLLEDVAHSRKAWKPLKAEEIQIRHASNGSSLEYGYWIGIDIEGRSLRDKKIVLDSGLWWKCPKVKQPLIYAGFYNEPKRVKNFSWDGGNDDIRDFSFNRTYLYLPLEKFEDIQPSWNRLIDALLKQLKKP